jgi:hypothetical protein
MRLCEYGCGQEAKFRSKGGIWMCSEFWQQCPAKRKETSIISKRTHNTKEYKEKARINTLNQFKNETPENKKIRINKVKKTCRMPKHIEESRIRSINLWKDDDLRDSMMNSMKKAKQDPLHRKVLSEIAKKRFKKETKEERLERIKKAKTGAKKYFENESLIKKKNRINSKKRTIEKLKKKHPLLYKVEEMRYNPDKPKDKEIQVRCKNNLCNHSKENNGWFTPNNKQIEQRITGLNTNTLYFYCSEKCKEECILFNLHEDPNRLAEYNKYNDRVYKVTYKSLMKYSNKIKDLELRGREDGYDLDHIFSIYEGFNKNIDPEIIGHWKNLRIIRSSKNRRKGKKSSIKISELINKIKEV